MLHAEERSAGLLSLVSELVSVFGGNMKMIDLQSNKHTYGEYRIAGSGGRKNSAACKVTGINNALEGTTNASSASNGPIASGLECIFSVNSPQRCRGRHLFCLGFGPTTVLERALKQNDLFFRAAGTWAHRSCRVRRSGTTREVGLITMANGWTGEFIWHELLNQARNIQNRQHDGNALNFEDYKM